MDFSCQGPLSMGFPRQEYWNGLPFPSPGGPPNPGIEHLSSALASGFFTTEPPGRTQALTANVYILFSFHCCCFSVAQSCLALCNPMDCNTPGSPVLHHLLEFSQADVQWVSDAIQPFCPLSFPSPPAFNCSQHQDLFQWVDSSNQMAKVLELQLQHQSFQWIFRTDFL